MHGRNGRGLYDCRWQNDGGTVYYRQIIARGNPRMPPETLEVIAVSLNADADRQASIDAIAAANQDAARTDGDAARAFLELLPALGDGWLSPRTRAWLGTRNRRLLA